MRVKMIFTLFLCKNFKVSIYKIIITLLYSATKADCLVQNKKNETAVDKYKIGIISNGKISFVTDQQ